MTKSDETWMNKLWEWADDNDISDEILPRDKDDLVNLTSLALGYRKITKIPKEIGNLTNLTWLHLRDIQITEVPKEIGNLTNLTLLNLDKNQLTKLPEEIINLTNLRGIALSDDIPPWEGYSPMTQLRDELSQEQEEWFYNVNNYEKTKEEKEWYENTVARIEVNIESELKRKALVKKIRYYLSVTLSLLALIATYKDFIPFYIAIFIILFITRITIYLNSRTKED